MWGCGSPQDAAVWLRCRGGVDWGRCWLKTDETSDFQIKETVFLLFVSIHRTLSNFIYNKLIFFFCILIP